MYGTYLLIDSLVSHLCTVSGMAFDKNNMNAYVDAERRGITPHRRF